MILQPVAMVLLVKEIDTEEAGVSNDDASTTWTRCGGDVDVDATKDTITLGRRGKQSWRMRGRLHRQDTALFYNARMIRNIIEWQYLYNIL